MERSAGLKRAYPWLILVSCCLLQGAGLGIVSNCAGVFYVPVMRDLGCSMSAISLHVTFNNVFQCVGTLFVARIIKRFKVKYMIPAAGIIVALSQISLAFSHSLVHWYVCAIIQGFFVVYVTGIIIPLAITNWFTKRAGFALGLTAMSAGLFGALMSALLGSLITSSSWRLAILVSGIAIFVMTVPTSWFFMAVDPKEKGCVPFGGERVASNSEDIQRSGVGFDLRVVSIVMICAVASFSTIFNNHLPALGEFGGIAIVAPAILLSINMFGNMSFKIGFGALNDYLGAKRTTLLGFLVLLCACFMLLFGGDLLVCMAAFMFGVNSFISTAQAPLIAKDMWTKSQYPMALQIVQISIRLSYAIFSYVEGALYDIWGNYTPLLWLQVADVAVGVLFVILIYAWRKRHA